MSGNGYHLRKRTDRTLPKYWTIALAHRGRTLNSDHNTDVYGVFLQMDERSCGVTSWKPSPVNQR